jgi:hypothetical protein
VLADVAIAPSQTSVATGNINDVRNFTVVLGGIAPIPRDRAGHPHPGQIWYEPDLDRFRYGKSDGSVGELLQSVSSIGKPLFKIKAVDTARNTATASADPDLTFSLDASATYEMEGDLYCSSSDNTNGNVLIDWVSPVGVAGRWAGMGVDTSDTNNSGTANAMRWITTALANPSVGSRSFEGVSGSTIIPIKISGIVRTSSAGTFALSWARSGSAGTVTMRQDSWLKMTRRA